MEQTKQNAEREKRELKPAAGKGLRPRTKRLMLILGVAALVLLLVLAALILFLPGGSAKQPLDRYLAENWTVFQLRSRRDPQGCRQNRSRCGDPIRYRLRTHHRRADRLHRIPGRHVPGMLGDGAGKPLEIQKRSRGVPAGAFSYLYMQFTAAHRSDPCRLGRPQWADPPGSGPGRRAPQRTAWPSPGPR